MANRYSFRSGQRQLVKAAVDSATVIEIGDMVWLDTDDVKPAADFTWDTDLETTQAAFAVQFLGIAVESSAAGDTAPISVDVSPVSVYEYDVASATYEIGTPLGPNGTGSALKDQELVAADAALSIARAVERKTAASTALRVQFASAYSTYANNTNATIGYSWFLDNLSEFGIAST